MVKVIAIGVGGSQFDSRIGQIGQRVTNGSPPLRRSLGCPDAKPRR